MNLARCRQLPKAVIASAMLVVCGAQAAEMTLYLQPNFSGRQVTLRGFTPNLGAIGFQDQVSSMVVQSGRWEVCTQPDFKGECVTLSPGDYAALDPRLNHRVESAREVRGDREQTGSYNAYG
ncbi:MAG: beta/gamma crystallin-related protein, partial [Usitatibacter sp.]